jgi:metal-responsive CopG/Arc/MetJ family transcriptional regulator
MPDPEKARGQAESTHGAMSPITVRIPEALRDELNQLVRVRHWDLSDIVRKALWEYIGNLLKSDMQPYGEMTAGTAILLTPEGYRPFQIVDGKYVETERPSRRGG